MRDRSDPDRPITGKRVLVHWRGLLRRYRWNRGLLEVSSLGDVIPGLETIESEEPAARHLHSDAAASADLVSVETPAPEVWERVRALPENFVESLCYEDPFTSP